MVQLVPDESRPLSEDAARLLAILWTLPLAGQSDLLPVLRWAPARFSVAIEELESAGLIGSAYLAWTVKQLTQRLWIQEEGQRWLEIDRPTWHDPGNLCELLARLPLVENFYPLVGRVDGLGNFQTFQWLSGLSHDADVRYEDGWVALFWSGVTEQESELRKRLMGFGEDVLTHAATDEQSRPWPSGFFFVAEDPWQKEVVMRVVRRFPEIWSATTVWDMTDGDAPRMEADPRKGGGWIRQEVWKRREGAWPWRRRLESSPWAREDAFIMGRMLSAVSQWVLFPTSLGRALLREGTSSRGAQKTLSALRDLGLLQSEKRRTLVEEAIEKGKGTPEEKDRKKRRASRQLGKKREFLYSPTNAGFERLTRRDGGAGINARAKRESAAKLLARQPQHEREVWWVSEQLTLAGFLTVPGTRSYEQLGPDGATAPDVIVLLHGGQFGTTWAYGEVELSARTPERVKDKAEAFGSPRRQDGFLLMMVCGTSEAEQLFHQVGNDGVNPRIFMVTTTLERIRKFGILGDETWSFYGERVSIGAAIPKSR